MREAVHGKLSAVGPNEISRFHGQTRKHRIIRLARNLVEQVEGSAITIVIGALVNTIPVSVANWKRDAVGRKDRAKMSNNFSERHTQFVNLIVGI